MVNEEVSIVIQDIRFDVNRNSAKINEMYENYENKLAGTIQASFKGFQHSFKKQIDQLGQDIVLSSQLLQKKMDNQNFQFRKEL